MAFRASPIVALIAAMFGFSSSAQAQVRGVYPVGMNATNSGVTPQPGVTYSNLFVFFSRDEQKTENGD